MAIRVTLDRILLDRRMSLTDLAAKVDVTLELRDGAHGEEVFAALAAAGYEPVRIAAASAAD